MFYIDDGILIKFGRVLADLRNETNTNLIELASATKIDIASLNRLEQGFIKKVNPLMLIKIADFYKVNVLYFYTLIGYVSNDKVIQYSNSIGYTSNVNIAIPLFNSIDSIGNKKHSIGKMNIPFSKNNSNLYSSFYSGTDIFIFYKTEDLNYEDSFVFLANSKYLISKYYALDSTIILNDIQDNYKLYTFDKNSVKVIGKIIYQIKKLAEE